MSQELGPRQKAFVDALRSGTYQQGRTRLEDSGKYCCLGVATVLAGVECGISCHMGTAVMDYYLFRTDLGGHVSDDCSYVSLAAINDRGTSFQEIADIIEQRAHSIFTRSA